MQKLLATTAIVLATGIPFSTHHAMALCIPDNPADGAVVTCSGNDTNGFDFGNADSITLNIESGASVTDAPGGNDAVRLGTDARINVQSGGTIHSAGDDAVQAEDGLIIISGGSIIGGDEAINAENNAAVANSGTITSEDDAVKVGMDSTIINLGLIENVGTDTANPEDAIDIDSGQIVNLPTGVIRSTLDAAIDFDEGSGDGDITNRGNITGTIGILTDQDNTGRQTVVNTGLIEGTSGVSVDLGKGKDSVRLDDKGRFVGDILLGAGRDVFILGSGSFGDMTGDFVANGGAGVNDTLDLSTYSAFDDRRVSLSSPNTFDISLASSDSDATIRFTQFEFFAFREITIPLSELMRPRPRQ
jgi:hypothetical protein